MKVAYSLLVATIPFPTQPTCAQSYGELNVSAVRARFKSDGLIARDTATGDYLFEVPNGSGVNALYSGGMWVTGVDDAENLHVAAMTYGVEGADFFPGPLTTDGTASTVPDVSAQFDHVWSVYRIDVEQHLNYFNCLSDPDCDPLVEFPGGYTIPPYFYDWPAINNEPGYDMYLAPFYDFDQDGAYDPDLGDAPCILGDQALFFVFNDKLAPHTYSGGLPLGIEVQAMPFAYTNEIPALEQTVFVRYHLVNRSTTAYHECRLGIFNDIDLGCAEDDFTGCDVLRNLGYVYNGDEVDEGCNGHPGYQAQPPAFGQVFLKGPLLDGDNSDDAVVEELPAWNGTGFEDGSVDNERSGMSSFVYFSREAPGCCNDPSLAVHFHNYLRSIWKDGTPMTYGGTGYSQSPDSLRALFMYPASSDPYGVGIDGPPQPPWQESELTNPDRRSISGMGPFSMDPGEHIDLLVAYVYARAATGGAFASVGALQTRVDSVRSFANTLPIWDVPEEAGFAGQCADYAFLAVTEETNTSLLDLFPVPATEHVQIRAARDLVGELLSIHDAIGRIVATHSLSQGLNDIDISSLARGVYTCEVRSARARYTGRLVKE